MSCFPCHSAGASPGLRKRRPSTLLLSFLILLATHGPAAAQNWTGTSSGNWYTNGNWSPSGVPAAGANITFGASSRTGVTINQANTGIGSLTMPAGASAYTITIPSSTVQEITTNVTGAGIINNSAATQTLTLNSTTGTNTQSAALYFYNNSQLRGFQLNINGNNGNGIGTSYVQFMGGSKLVNSTVANSQVGYIGFNGTASIENSTITNGPPPTDSTTGSQTQFLNNASAGTATIINQPGNQIFGAGGWTTFYNSSTAASASITANGGSFDWGGEIEFHDTSTAGAATLTANGTAAGAPGQISFHDNATGGTARVVLNGGGLAVYGAPLSVGSIEGNSLGGIYLPGSSLTVGSLNTNTTFGGTIDGDGGLVKTGTGSLTLTHSSSFWAGGVTLQNGRLVAGHNRALGTGAVTATGGVLHEPAGIAVANTITLNGGSLTHDMPAGAGLMDAVNTRTTLGGLVTSARILDGVTTGATMLDTSFSASSGAVNDAVRQSAVYHFQGTGSDAIVLELTMAGPGPNSAMGWRDAGNRWVNAVDGNTGNNATPAMRAWDGSFAEFQAQYGTDPGSYLGAWGTDDASGAVWAVINHNGDFAVTIPEPGAASFVMLLTLAALSRHARTGRPDRYRSTHVERLCL